MNPLDDLFGGNPTNNIEVVLGVGAMDYETAKKLSEKEDRAQGELLLDAYNENKYNLTPEEIEEIEKKRW